MLKVIMHAPSSTKGNKNGRGHRAGNEFRGTERVREQRRNTDVQPANPTPAWPSLRIVRMAEIDPTLYATRDWGNTLNDIGRKNYGIGRGLSLGSVSISLVSANHMGWMLAHKYPHKYQDRGETLQLHHALRGRMKHFLRSATSHAFDARTGEMQQAYDAHFEDIVTVGFSNELEDESFDRSGISSAGLVADERASASAQALEAALPLATDRIVPYAAGSLVVNGLGIFGHGYALDLTLNENLYSEREGLINYLRREEGLNTSQIERDGWEAHATVFSFYDHIRAAQLVHSGEIPDMMDFEAVRTDVY